MISQQLMLGDWVMLNPDLKEYYPFAGKPCMVIGLHDDDGAIKIEYDNGKYFWTDAEDDVIPIPLTPEILEKNGFNQVIDSCKVNTYHDRKTGINIIMFSTPEITILQELFLIKNLKICYVHELQHLLKLCRIEKQIEL